MRPKRSGAWLVGVGLLVAAVVAWQLRDGSRVSHDDVARRSGSGAHARATIPDSSTTIGGRVTRADGSAIANAVVTIAHTDLVVARADLPTIAVATDRDGVWNAPVLPGAYMVAATAVGFLPRHEPVAVAAGAHASVNLTLAPGGITLRGTVTDIGGGPVANVQIAVTGDDLVEVASLTGTDGTYQLTVPTGSYTLFARHDDYDHLRTYVDLVDLPVTRDLTLVPVATITGVVIARDTGKPVADAHVTTEDRIEVGTDADGSFTLHALGAVQLSATARGYASRNPLAVDAGIGEHVGPVVVMVDHAFAITGRVVRERSHEPIAGVRVGGSYRDSPTAMTDASGTFELLGIRPESYLLVLRKDGFVSKRLEAIDVVDHDVTGLAFELEEGVTIAGRVEPSGIATMSVVSNTDDSRTTTAYLDSLHATSDAQGGFVIHGVPPGHFKLGATTATGDAGLLRIEVANQGLSNLVVTLESRATVSGKVVDAAGVPISGVEVRADAIATGGSDITHGDGSFKITGLRHEEISIAVTDPEWSEDTGRTSLDLSDGRDRSNVVLTAKRGSGTIRGRVIADGKPAEVWVGGHDDTDDDLGQVLTDANGAFAFQHVRPGTYTITARSVRGDASGREDGVKVGATITIALATLQKVTVHVTAAGNPVPIFTYDCDAATQHVVSPDGTWTIDHLPPGDQRCTFGANEWTVTQHVSVPAHGVVEVVLAPRGVITGSIVDAKGAPVTGYEISFTSRATGYVESDDSMPTSHFEFKRAAGEVVIEIRSGDRHVTRTVSTTGGLLDLGAIALPP